MRDLLLIGFVLGTVPFILARPYIGVLLFAWLGYMNPHREFAWDLAQDFPLSMVVGAVTLISMVWSRDTRKLPFTPIMIVWFLWIFWTNITTFFALVPEEASLGWEKSMKVQLMTLVTVMLLQSKERILLLVWVIAYSVGYYGIKGGIFSIQTGGQFRVWGPEYTFFAGNNEVGLALLMVLPLMFFLRNQSSERWIRLAILLGTGLTIVAVIGTYSRGAFVAAAVALAFLATKLRQKVVLVPLLLIGAAGLAAFMPEQYYERIETITNYEEDGSAMGRINAWTVSWRLAMDRPLVGGGFNTFTEELYERYLPEVDVGNPDVHSIYFQALAEHGFVGCGLFVLLLLMALYQARAIRKAVRDRPDMKWAADLASMTQVGIVAYAVGGAFLGLANFDLYYHLIAILILTRLEVKRGAVTGDASELVHRAAKGVRQPRLGSSP